jgi:hypothetical protein
MMLPSSRAALNVGTLAADDMVTKLRQSIFIETQYLEERQEQRCSSLDGPRCLMQMGFHSRGGVSTKLGQGDIPGVIPELLLRDLGVDDGFNFSTPDFNTLSYIQQMHENTLVQTSSPKLLTGTEDAMAIRSARHAAQRGLLHFADITDGSRVPLTFSRGLPGMVVATWDGKWIAQDCDAVHPVSFHHSGQLSVASRQPLALPVSVDDEGKASDPYAPALTGKTSVANATTVARLASSVGYLRFSRPVIVRSLLARWQPEVGAVPAVVGARLGLDGIWTTHLDPTQVDQGSSWYNLGSDPLQPIDEIAFIAASGLEIGALDVVAYGGDGMFVDEHSVLLLAPVPPETVARYGEGDDKPQFALSVRKMTPGAAPFIVSLQEAVDRNLKLQPPSAKAVRYAAPSAALVSRSGNTEHQLLQWKMVSAANQAMFDRDYLALGSFLSEKSTSTIHPLQAYVLALSNSLHLLPRDLQQNVLHAEGAITESVIGYLSAGSRWDKRTPSVLPQQGSEDTLKRYIIAKQWQRNFDLLTAAFLHTSSQQVLQRAQALATQVRSEIQVLDMSSDAGLQEAHTS